MIVKKPALVAVYKALGVDTVGAWPLAKLIQKTNAPGGIARYRNPGSAIDDPAASALFDEITAAQANNDPIEIEDDVTASLAPPVPAKKSVAKKPVSKKVNAKPAATAAAKKPAPKKAPVKKPSGRGGATAEGRKAWAAQLKAWANKPAVLGNKGAGVFQTILTELKVAGFAKAPTGVTKEFLLDVLKAKFPDRDPMKMQTSINNLVPSRLEYKFHIRVQKVRGEDKRMRYYVVEDKAAAKASAAKPAPKKPAKKPAKAAAV